MMNILVVEDEPLITSFLERGLTAEGHAVETADDGAQAIERVRGATVRTSSCWT